MRSSPLDQAHRFVGILLRKFKEKGLTPPPVGLGVVFPDTDFDLQPTQGDLEGLVIGARDLPYLEEALPRVLERALREHTWRSPSPEFGTRSSTSSSISPISMELPSRSLESGHEPVASRSGRGQLEFQLDKEQFTALESWNPRERYRSILRERGGNGQNPPAGPCELAVRDSRAGERSSF